MATYLVTDTNADKDELPKMVECRTKQQAIGVVAGQRFEATPIDTKTAIAWTKKGVALQEVGGE